MWMMALAIASETPKETKWTVTVDPLTLAIGYAHVQVERKLSKHTSLYAGPHLRLFDGILSTTPEPYIGLGVELGFRYFPWGKAPRGPWAMARTVGAFLTTTRGPKANSPGGYSSVLVGYTGIIADHFVLSGGAGLNYFYYQVGGYGPSGPILALHTNIGVAF